MKKVCTLCGGATYNIYVFKSGYVCEDCLQQLKSGPNKHDQTRIER